jgi:ATP/maltotriose-dependent transcriptional regulator MalT
LSESEQSTCWEVIGRAELNSGAIERGLKAIHRALQAADDSHDPRTKARLIVANCDALLHGVGIDSAAAEIPKLRRAAIATGDPFCSVSLHSLVAEIKAQKGSIASAKTSVDTARSLLERWPNVWQKGRIAVTSAGLHIIESDYEKALAATLEALDCAEKTGSRRLRIPALGNLAHIKLAQGELDDAENAVSEFLTTALKGGNAEIAGLDNRLQIALAQGDKETSRQLALRAFATSAALDGGTSYHGLWLTTTKIKWHFQLGEVEKGVNFAFEAIPHVRRIEDRNLLTRLRLLAAEGLARLNRPEY